MHLTILLLVTIVLHCSNLEFGGIHLQLTQAINIITFSIQEGDLSITGRQLSQHHYSRNAIFRSVQSGACE